MKESFNFNSFNLFVAVTGPLVVQYIQNRADLVLNTAELVWFEAHKTVFVDKGHYSFVLVDKIFKQDRELLLQDEVFSPASKLVDRGQRSVQLKFQNSNRVAVILRSVEGRVVVKNSLTLSITMSFGRLNTPAPVEVFCVYAYNRLPFTLHNIVSRWGWLLGIEI